MGALFSTLMSLLNSKQEHKLIIVGTGQRREDDQPVQTLPRRSRPHAAHDREQRGGGAVQERGLRVWDLGGQTTLRQSWASYYRNTAAVIMMVDSTDRGRMGLVRDELFRLLANEELDPKGVLVLANKQDLPDAMSVAELSEALNLHAIKGHEWHIQASCALTGEGLWEGLDWVSARCTG